MARVACLLALGACVSANKHSESVFRVTGSLARDGDGTRGGDLTASVGGYGFHGFAGVFADGLYRHRTGDPGRRYGGGLELGFRGSLFGVFADDHAFEHWLDLGWQFGFGPGIVHTSRYETIANMWGGAWLEIGPGRDSWYPAVFLDVRYKSYTDPFDSAAVYSIGLSFVKRTPLEGFQWRD